MQKMKFMNGNARECIIWRTIYIQEDLFLQVLWPIGSIFWNFPGKKNRTSYSSRKSKKMYQNDIWSNRWKKENIHDFNKRVCEICIIDLNIRCLFYGTCSTGCLCKIKQFTCIKHNPCEFWFPPQFGSHPGQTFYVNHWYFSKIDRPYRRCFPRFADSLFS